MKGFILKLKEKTGVKFVTHLSYSIVIVILLAISLYSCDKGQSSDLIEQIGEYKVTKKSYEDYYSSYFEKASRLINAEKKTLYSLMCNPDEVPPNSDFRMLIERLQPEVNYEEFRQLRIIEQAAKKQGFLDRPVVKQIIEQVVLETVARLYLQEKMDERIKITQEQKEQKCEELRRLYPDKVKPLPIDRCLEVAQGFLKQEIVMREEPRLRDEIKEAVVINRNNDFNREQYLKTGVEFYNTILKEGGCTAPQKPAANLPVPGTNNPGTAQTPAMTPK